MIWKHPLPLPYHYSLCNDTQDMTAPPKNFLYPDATLLLRSRACHLFPCLLSSFHLFPPFSPFPLAYSITHKMRPFMIWPSPTYSVLSSLLHTSKAIFSGWFVFLLLNYMENSTAHHNVHFHWEVFLGLRDRFSSALTDSSLRWPPEIPASWYLCLPEFCPEFRQNQWWLVSN